MINNFIIKMKLLIFINNKMDTKIKFINVNKLKNPKPQLPIVRIGSSGRSVEKHDDKNSRLIEIDQYFLKLSDIERSKKGSGGKVYDLKKITSIYTLIFEKKKSPSMSKNELIEEILRYYRDVHVPSVQSFSNGGNIDTTTNFSQVQHSINITAPFLNNEIKESNLSDDSEDEFIY